MKRLSKQLLAVLLALFMFASMSFPAFAADEATDVSSFEVIFDTNGGSFSDGTTSTTVTATPSTIPGISGWTLTTPAQPTFNGKTFAGWLGGNITLNAGESALLTQKVTSFTAQWKDDEVITPPESFSVTFDANGGSFADGTTSTTVTATPSDIPGVSGWMLTTPAEPTYNGKTFTGWLGNGVTLNANMLGMLSQRITSFTAQWEDDGGDKPDPTTKCKITYETAHGTAPEAKEVDSGYKLTDEDLPILSAEGYEFMGWFCEDDPCEAGRAIAVDITLTAKWEAKQPDPETPTQPTRPSQPSGGGSPSSSGGSSTPSYRVSGGSGEADNGSWTIDKTSAKKGDTVTITLKPSEGYRGMPTVKDSKGSSVELTKKDDATYTFVMPDGNVTVSAEFTALAQEPDPEPVNPFTDVSEDAYYYNAVLWAASQGITEGDGSASVFSPGKLCTRAEIVTFLWRAAGSPEVETSIEFTDVPAGAYYAKAVAWAVSEGITQGDGAADTFSPNGYCTRAQAVTFLHRYADEPNAAEGGFADVPAGEYYANAVNWAASKGITNGDGAADIFNPNAYCTRGHIVTFLYRAQ